MSGLFFPGLYRLHLLQIVKSKVHLALYFRLVRLPDQIDHGPENYCGRNADERDRSEFIGRHR